MKIIFFKVLIKDLSPYDATMFVELEVEIIMSN